MALATNSKVSRAQHSECANQFVTVFLNRSRDDRCLPDWGQTPPTDQQTTGRRLPLPEDEFAEILVSRDQHARRKIRPSIKDDFIHDARRNLSYVCNRIAIEAKAFDYLTVDAFIGEESHRGIVARG
jgi:hypothetical protein